MTIEVISPDVLAVVVEAPQEVIAEVQEPAGITVVTVAQQGPPGPAGPSGTANIGGFPTEIEGLAPGDLLVFSGDAWVNENKVKLTDGGNF